jgi:hypothetical protein
MFIIYQQTAAINNILLCANINSCPIGIDSGTTYSIIDANYANVHLPYATWHHCQPFIYHGSPITAYTAVSMTLITMSNNYRTFEVTVYKGQCDGQSKIVIGTNFLAENEIVLDFHNSCMILQSPLEYVRMGSIHLQAMLHLVCLPNSDSHVS